MITRMKEQAGIHSEVVGSVIDAVAQAIAEDKDEVEIYTSGATNIFKYPELADTSKASELISAFEENMRLRISKRFDEFRRKHRNSGLYWK